MSENPYRLPRTVTPSRYDLLLEPDLDSAEFAGTVVITLTAPEPVANVVLNAAELDLDGATLDDDPTPMLITYDEETERATFTPADGSTIAAGAHSMRIAFRGTINDKLRGFYRSTFTNEDGEKRVIGTTQMQATDARRAFPCFDEPDFKAVFALTLVVDGDLLAVSNEGEIGRTPAADGKVTVRFADTIPMSTYLLAWTIGPLEATDPVDVDGIPVRIIHVPGKRALTGFALDCAAFCLRHFMRYYALPYPGRKCDLAALPDFAAGAMENLGLITFREALLLVDPATATQAEEQLVADVTAHELAHMWFGDLVTMRWWNGIWLNEAFATFMEIAAVDAYRPEWNRWTSFGLARTVAFDADALVNTRPIEFEVVSPHDADGMFDVLTYEKGAAILRMLEQYLGEDRFRDGIRHYLATHAYGNTETGDLWDAIEHVTGEPVRRIMDSWIWQGGHPVVTARPSADGATLELTQRRFLFDADSPEDARWAIPLLVRQFLPDGSDRVDRVLLDGDRAGLALTPGAAVVVNAGAHAFLRVRYEGGLRDRLSGHLLTELAPAERYALVDDAWAAVVAGDLDAGAYCAFIRAFADESETPIWQSILATFGWIDRFVEGSARAGFQQFVRGLVAPALARLGWDPVEGEADLTRDLRGALVRGLAVLGADPTAADRARALFDAAERGETIEPALLAAATGVVAATGSDADQERFMDRARTSTNPQEQLRFLYALADFPTDEQFDRTVGFALGGEVRTQNAPFLLQRCLRHREHGGRAWHEIARRWDEIDARFPANTIVRMVDGVKAITDPAAARDVQAFFGEHDIPQARKTLAQVLERQRVNVALRERESGPLEQVFRS